MATIPEENQKSEIIKYETTDTQLLKRTHKLSKEDEEAIITSYYLNRKKETIKHLSARYNVSTRYIYRLIERYKKNKEEIIDKTIKKASSLFTKKNKLIMEEIQSMIFDKLKSGDDINLTQLATTYGVLYDKTALEEGKATSNNAFSINIKIDKQ